MEREIQKGCDMERERKIEILKACDSERERESKIQKDRKRRRTAMDMLN